LREVGRWLRVLGPGLITGAADDDPSGIGTYSQTGAAYGVGQLWLVLYMLPLMIAVQEMCGRIGLVTGKGIAGVVRTHYGRRVLYGAVALLFAANTINVGADLGAMAASARLLVPGVPFVGALIVFALGILGLEIFVPYRHYARVLKLLTLSLLAYIITGIVIGPDWGMLLRATVLPQVGLTPAFLALVVGVLGTTISPYLFFWQASEEVEEEEAHHRLPRGHDLKRQRLALLLQIRALRLDTALGMLVSQVTTWFIIVTTSETLHAHNVTDIQSADQAAAALAPLVHSFPNSGDLARLLFALGIVGTGLLAVPVLAGSAAYGIAEAFGWREGLARTVTQARGFYGVIALATLVGLALNLLGVNPISALVYTAVINGIVAVPLLVLILLVANNRDIMGKHTNGRLANVVGWLTAALMGIAGVATVVTAMPH
jgi:NRAMP (natural resistance-associated macrophage protein)-like metal ion transporter